jgi:hypothetical protein
MHMKENPEVESLASQHLSRPMSQHTQEERQQAQELLTGLVEHILLHNQEEVAHAPQEWIQSPTSFLLVVA